MHLGDVMAHLQLADQGGDRHTGIEILEQARATIRMPEIETLLVERYLELPVEQAEVQLRQWWEHEHDRFSGAGLAQVLTGQDRKKRPWPFSTRARARRRGRNTGICLARCERSRGH
jgi:hypothetical protein